MASSFSSAVLRCLSSLPVHSRFSVTPIWISTQFPVVNPRNQSGLVVRFLSSIDLVDRSEAETVNRLKIDYLEKVRPQLIEEFSYKNIHEVPKIEKIVVSCGIKDAAQNPKRVEAAMKDLSMYTGQSPVRTRAKQSSNVHFKNQEDFPVSKFVTLRGNMMYAFLDRLINVGLPRERDFRDLDPSSFEGPGNFSIRMREQSGSPDTRFDVIGKPRGMDVCITTTAKTDNEAQRLLTLMGMPFKEGDDDSTTVVVRKKREAATHLKSKHGGRK
eukprot:TRINITY_DN7606_c0_g2_i1.p1 TRINITY_DN7606_c0_g2~~TRINITY_DN7606_c0_g2_i1.p1  ORF type:complete len:271 (-),score=40.54 TRINITY_DN7606_c0_g2_i1:307-1119(-)